MIKLKEMISKYLYHVTPKRNLQTIKRTGILPKKPEFVEDEEAVYLFKDKMEMEDAVSNWLGDRYGAEEELVVLIINPVGLNIRQSNVGYEVLSYEPIPWANVVGMENI